MSEKGFEPLTSQLGISGTSYRLQLGLINEKWASRILRGKDVIDSYVYKERDLGGKGEDTFPVLNFIVGWVLRTVAIPNINPYQIQKTSQVLVKQGMENRKKRKVKMAVSSAKDVELEVVPESELKRPKVQGWVKEEGVKTRKEQEEEQRAAFKERVSTSKAAETTQPTETAQAGFTATAQKTQTTPVATVKTTRKLPSIPKAGGAETAQPASSEGSKDISSFCPSCGKDLTWKFCPYCGKPLPHT